MTEFLTVCGLGFMVIVGLGWVCRRGLGCGISGLCSSFEIALSFCSWVLLVWVGFDCCKLGFG